MANKTESPKLKSKSAAKSIKHTLEITKTEADFDSKEDVEVTYRQPNIDKSSKVLTAQDILTKSAEELDADTDKRELHNLLKRMKILTAILLGNHQNKELSRVLDTDKSFTSKQIKELEDEGLVKREIDGREVKYEVDRFNLLKFLSTKVTIKWKKEEEDKN